MKISNRLPGTGAGKSLPLYPRRSSKGRLRNRLLACSGLLFAWLLSGLLPPPSFAQPLALPYQALESAISKAEIIALLKHTDPRRLSQVEIVDELERRGLAFKVDEALLKELQQNGARAFVLDAVKRLGENGGKMPVNPEEIEDPSAREKARAEALAKLPFIEQTRRYALDYAKELPNFIVTQIVSRYVQTPEAPQWKLDDTLEIELTYSASKGEQFKVLKINGKAAQKSYDELGGSTSSGEFGSLLEALFLPQSKAEFTAIKKDVINKRTAMIYEFRVTKNNSTSLIVDKASNQKTIAGYTGSLWIDTESKKVLRIETANEGVPAGFPVTLSENAVEYDWVTIEGERYLLPVRAEVLLGRDRERIYTRNVIEFRGYKKFEARIKIE